MSNYTLFISDLHLDERTPELTRYFLDLLNTEARQADALYILGDLFEAWLGDDDLSPHNQRIIHGLYNLSHHGVPVYFMRGNRDFMVGKQFAQLCKLTLIKDPSRIELYGKPVLLMHGDTLCTDDVKATAFRKKTQNRFYIGFFNLTPLWLRRRLARYIRNKSRAHTQKTNMSIMDVTQQAVHSNMLEQKVNLLIHGHTHRPKVHAVDLNGTQGERIVLGAWHGDQAEVLYFYADGQYELKPYKFNTSN